MAPTPWVFLGVTFFCDTWHVTLSHDCWSEFSIWCNKETPSWERARWRETARRAAAAADQWSVANAYRAAGGASAKAENGEHES